MQGKTGKKVKVARARTRLPFSRSNYFLFGVAALFLFVGYWALSQPPVDGFLSLTLAPILLVIGYCVVIPLAILWPGKRNSNSRQSA
ncbi:MAG: hypothetical protein D6743_06200 [Calditrichaeota bacterium]|nr:MAG: hypothetical protein D6743_06200 [Calditrichota bacterium]